MAKPLVGPGDLIVSSWENLRTHFRSYSQLAVWFAVLSVVQWAVFVLSRALVYDKVYRTVVHAVLSLPLSLAYALLSIAVIDLTARTLMKKKAVMNEVFLGSLHKLIPFLWVAFLLWTVTMFGLILLVIPGIIFFFWFKFAIPNLVVDDIHGLDALRMSKMLVDGRWWAVMFRVLIPAIFWYVAASFILRLLYLLVGSSLGDPGLFFSNFTTSDELSNSFILVTTVIPAVINAYALPLLTGSDLLLWSDLKRTS